MQRHLEDLKQPEIKTENNLKNAPNNDLNINIKLDLGEAASQNQMQIATKPAQETNSSKVDLLDALKDIVNDPNSKEEAWLSAAHILNQQEANNSQNTKNRKIKLAIILAIVAVFSTGIAANLNPTIGNMLPFLQVGQRDVDFSPYMHAVETAIKKNWKPEMSSTDHLIKVHFKVMKNGEIKDLGFDRMSHVSNQDTAAIKAIIDAMPSLPPLPAGAPDDVDISFTFEYKTDSKQPCKNNQIY